MSAGALPKSPPALDPNEDVGAVVHGARGLMLVVADGHYGREASEVVVGHVLHSLGDDPPAADLSDDELVRLFFDAGVAVQRETTRPDARHPYSCTTLALVLVADGFVEWASFGDSCVLMATSGSGARLDTPRNVYLGQRFTIADISGALGRGRHPVVGDSCVVLATDGLTDSLARAATDPIAALSQEVRTARAARDIAEGLLDQALRLGARDAVSVAVARL
jgi:serine/threonine protein phosphatase PrpC